MFKQQRGVGRTTRPGAWLESVTFGFFNRVVNSNRIANELEPLALGVTVIGKLTSNTIFRNEPSKH